MALWDFSQNRPFWGYGFRPLKSRYRNPVFCFIAGKTGLCRLPFGPDFERPVRRFGGISDRKCGIFCKNRPFRGTIGKISGHFSPQDPLSLCLFSVRNELFRLILKSKKRAKRPISMGFWDGFVGFSAKIAFLGVRSFLPGKSRPESRFFAYFPSETGLFRRFCMSERRNPEGRLCGILRRKCGISRKKRVYGGTETGFFGKTEVIL